MVGLLHVSLVARGTYRKGMGAEWGRGKRGREGREGWKGRREEREGRGRGRGLPFHGSAEADDAILTRLPSA